MTSYYTPLPEWDPKPPMRVEWWAATPTLLAPHADLSARFKDTLRAILWVTRGDLRDWRWRHLPWRMWDHVPPPVFDGYPSYPVVFHGVGYPIRPIRPLCPGDTHV